MIATFHEKDIQINAATAHENCIQASSRKILADNQLFMIEQDTATLEKTRVVKSMSTGTTNIQSRYAMPTITPV